MAELSVVIPARDEAEGIVDTVAGVARAFVVTPHTVEIIVVDDGSRDATASLALSAGATVVTQPTNKGYGNALLAGVRRARHAWIAIADADGTYPLDRLPEMLDLAVSRELDMVVGARNGKHYDGPWRKRTARLAFKWLSEWVVGETIPDINSGLRVMRRDMVLAFARALSGGFSFTTSITIIAFQTAHHVAYIPIDYFPRKGRSHVRPWRDTMRALQIIVMIIVLFNPVKLYLLQAVAVCIWSIAAMAVVLAFQNTANAALILTAGFCTANLVMAQGFRAVREQVNLSGIDLPRRQLRGDLAEFTGNAAEESRRQ